MSTTPRRPPTSGAEIGTVLAEVRDCGPCTVRDIATATGLSQSTVRRHLAELESSGLVESDNYQRRARVYMDSRENEPRDPVSAQWDEEDRNARRQLP